MKLRREGPGTKRLFLYVVNLKLTLLENIAIFLIMFFFSSNCEKSEIERFAQFYGLLRLSSWISHIMIISRFFVPSCLNEWTAEWDCGWQGVIIQERWHGAISRDQPGAISQRQEREPCRSRSSSTLSLCLLSVVWEVFVHLTVHLLEWREQQWHLFILGSHCYADSQNDEYKLSIKQHNVNIHHVLPKHLWCGVCMLF